MKLMQISQSSCMTKKLKPTKIILNTLDQWKYSPQIFLCHNNLVTFWNKCLYKKTTKWILPVEKNPLLFHWSHNQEKTLHLMLKSLVSASYSIPCHLWRKKHSDLFHHHFLCAPWQGIFWTTKYKPSFKLTWNSSHNNASSGLRVEHTPSSVHDSFVYTVVLHPPWMHKAATGLSPVHKVIIALTLP